LPDRGGVPSLAAVRCDKKSAVSFDGVVVWSGSVAREHCNATGLKPA